MSIALRNLFSLTPPASRRNSLTAVQSNPSVSSVKRTTELSIKIGVGALKRIAALLLSDAITICHIAETKSKATHGVVFRCANQLPYAGRMELSDVSGAFLARAVRTYPKSTPAYQTLERAIFHILKATTINDLLSAIDSLFAIIKPLNQHFISNNDPRVEQTYFRKLLTDTHLILKWEQDLGIGYVDAVGNMLHRLRSEKRLCSSVEVLALYVGYKRMMNGQSAMSSHNSRTARCLGTPGFRFCAQTYMSLTDPGDGHIFGTTRKQDWMRGVIVHVEHLERPGHLPRRECESYRIPSIVDFGRVRLHVGSAAPTTYYVGRMMRDGGNFDQDLIKVVNTVSAAATAAFAAGSAECKVSMDGLTTSQMVTYMRALSAHTTRAPNRQYFSCAFNINNPVCDNMHPYSRDVPRMLTNMMDIGRRGIKIAALGGFDKITWDGASDEYPSKCIIERLGFCNALELVHLAHEAGFVTYFSAGFKMHQIANAVLTGVDAIGIGGAQVLRYMDHETGMHGPYMEENIDEILSHRDTAERSLRGRGVALLCRLDRMYYEGSISETLNRRREKLYTALAEQRHGCIKRAIKKCSAVAELSHDGEAPFTGQARRLIAAERPVLKSFARDNQQWADFVQMILKCVAYGSEQEVYEEYLSPPWSTWRAAYRAAEDTKREHLYLAKALLDL
ncbi:hypothetical protein HDU87_007056 [Geranomyces variabilis]|uniref:Uncharacterized protein n=1 Tax=Geranomyces variabilis TaxID=109894 RepID=A0AAD5TFQ0_9FUNG|nr:hypothetical protein HDU87_007056 [Geranomyces variabilis]